MQILISRKLSQNRDFCKLFDFHGLMLTDSPSEIQHLSHNINCTKNLCTYVFPKIILDFINHLRTSTSVLWLSHRQPLTIQQTRNSSNYLIKLFISQSDCHTITCVMVNAALTRHPVPTHARSRRSAAEAIEATENGVRRAASRRGVFVEFEETLRLWQTH